MYLKPSLFCYEHITILTYFPSLRTSLEIANRIQNRELLDFRGGGMGTCCDLLGEGE